jgi:hypothetical protein
MATIIFIFFWGVAMLRCGSFKSHLALSYRVQNALLSLYLVILSSPRLYFLISLIVHPGLFHSTLSRVLYVQSGIFPPFAALLSQTLVIFASVVELNIGLLMAQQKSRVWILAIRFVPYIAAIEVLDAVRFMSARAESAPQHPTFLAAILAAVLLLLPFICIYIWLYRFCRSRRTQELMEMSPNTALEPTPTAP